MDNQPIELPMAQDTGCVCCSTTPTSQQIQENTAMSTQTFAVSGMTCGHCAGAVTSELKALSGVSDVNVNLVAGGTSTVTVASDAPLTEADVAAALEEAGDYHLATS